MIDLHQMRQFIAVAEEGNFHRAAERLYMTQPPLSMAVKKLEEELGCLLLTRKHKGFSLTAAGEAFLTEARQMMQSAEQMVRLVQEVADGRAGRVRLSFVGSALYGKLPGVIRYFRKQCGDVRLELRTATSQRQYEMLRNNETDIAVLNEPAHRTQDFDAFVFDEDRLCLALPINHPLAAKNTTLAKLRNEPFIIWPREQGRGFYDKAVNLCVRAGFSPNIVQEAHQMQAILSLVAVEAGIAIIPQSMADFRRGEITYLPLHDSEAVFHRFMLCRKGEENAAARRFLDMALSSKPARHENKKR